MRLEVHSRLVFEFPQPTETIAAIQVAYAAGQIIESEGLWLPQGMRLGESIDPVSGARLLRGCLSGTVTIEYRATVRVSPRLTLPPNLTVAPWSQLPVAVLPYLLPSRFCPVDQFLRFSARKFGHVSPGGARVLSILDWLHANVDYVHGISTASTSAADTFIDCAGVCRDFTHLGMTLCRAAGVPARAVSAYALGLDPPDFHAVFEVFLDGGWWLVDPTRLAPIEGLVRIAHGRDAADIAFLTTAGSVIQTAMEVSVRNADAVICTGPLAKPRYDTDTVESASVS